MPEQIEINLIEQQIKDQRKELLLNRLDLQVNNSTKGVMVLNSGALIAVLGFMQALAEHNITAFKAYALGAMICFQVGVFIAAFAFYARHQQVLKEYLSENYTPWKSAVWMSILYGMLFFMAGLTVIMAGVAFGL